MANKKFLIDNLLIALASIIGISMIFAVHIVFAAPTTAPPNGNPSYPDGAVGPRGNTGNTGSKGSTGNTGSKGNKGLAGLRGAGSCDWDGGVWISHGHDGGCAWSVGAYWYCNSGRLDEIRAFNDNNCGSSGGWTLN